MTAGLNWIGRYSGSVSISFLRDRLFLPVHLTPSSSTGPLSTSVAAPPHFILRPLSHPLSHPTPSGLAKKNNGLHPLPREPPTAIGVSEGCNSGIGWNDCAVAECWCSVGMLVQWPGRQETDPRHHKATNESVDVC